VCSSYVGGGVPRICGPACSEARPSNTCCHLTVPCTSSIHHRHPHAAQQMGTQPSGENLCEDLMARHMLSTKRKNEKKKNEREIEADKVNFSNEHISQNRYHQQTKKTASLSIHPFFPLNMSSHLHPPL